MAARPVLCGRGQSLEGSSPLRLIPPQGKELAERNHEPFGDLGQGLLWAVGWGLGGHWLATGALGL